MKVVRRDPNKGYIDTWLWIPRSYINVEATKSSLTFALTDSHTGTEKYLMLYEEAVYHLKVPRAFWDPESLPFEVVDCRPRRFEHVPFTSRVQLDYRLKEGVDGVEALLPTGGDVQRRSFDALSNAMGGILQLACGKGKGQPLHEVVMTPTGPRPIGELVPGDLVLGSSGRPTKVLGTFPQGTRPVYRVHFSDETSVLCDEEHLWAVRYDRRKEKVVRTGDIKDKLRSNAGWLYAVKYPGPAQLQTKEPLPLPPWLLGAWLGDGSGTRFCNPEPDLQRKFMKQLPLDSSRLYELPHRCPEVRVKSRMGGTSDLQSQLSFLGLWGATSSTKFIPRSYLHATVGKRWELLRGLCDTDGSIANQNKTVEYTTVSAALARDVVYLVRSLGGRVSQRARTTEYSYLGEKRKGQQSYRLRITFPAGGARPVSSDKHLRRWDSTPGQRQHKYITDIEYIGDEKTVCIKVAAQDQCYLTRDFTVTHNTPTMLHFIASQQVPALVMVDNMQLLEQWSQEIETFLDVPGGVGRIAGGKKDWKKGLVLATYTSVANWADTMPEEVRRWFGVVAWDEGHHVNAPVFSKTATALYGKRYCLTATPERVDGSHIIADVHVGKVLYKDLTQPLTARFIFYFTGLKPDPTDPECRILDKNNEVHLSMVFTYFGRWRTRLYRILQDSVDAVQVGRRVLVVCNSVDEVVNLFCLWTFGGGANLITDIPYPTPEDVGETALPHEVNKVQADRLEKSIRYWWDKGYKLWKHGGDPAKLAEAQRKFIGLMSSWRGYLVYKKCERLHERHRKAFIKELIDVPSSAGFMVYGVPAKTRQNFAQTRSVTFAIMKYGKEGLDAPHLDTILVPSPFSNKAGLQQLMGRITGRPKVGKKSCIVAIYRDDVGPIHGMCKKLEKHLREWPVEEGGPFTFEHINNPGKEKWQKAKDLKEAFGQ